MITSDKQYKAAVEQLEMLSVSLSKPTNQGVPTVVENAAKSQLRELISEIKANIEEYTNATTCSVIEIHSLDDLLSAPIRYRLAAHMSIDVFGQKVGVSPRQISRYEKEEYRNITASTLQKILKKLDIHIDGRIAKIRENKKDIFHERHARF